MKRKKMLVAAVLLLAVLLFFWKKWGRIPGENTAEPTKTPTPTVTVPEQWKNVWILSSEEASVTFFYEGRFHRKIHTGMAGRASGERIGTIAETA
mgnify:CR=1 FL=1